MHERKKTKAYLYRDRHINMSVTTSSLTTYNMSTNTDEFVQQPLLLTSRLNTNQKSQNSLQDYEQLPQSNNDIYLAIPSVSSTTPVQRNQLSHQREFKQRGQRRNPSEQKFINQRPSRRQQISQDQEQIILNKDPRTVNNTQNSNNKTRFIVTPVGKLNIDPLTPDSIFQASSSINNKQQSLISPTEQKFIEEPQIKNSIMSTNKIIDTPQNEYSTAINFSEQPYTDGNFDPNVRVTTDQPYTETQHQSKIKQMMANVLKSTNESKYVYPSVAIVVASLFVILLLFQKISTGIKIIAVVILLLFIAFTVYQFKRH